MTWFDPETGAPRRYPPMRQRRSVAIPVMSLVLVLSGLGIVWYGLSSLTAHPVTTSPLPVSTPMSIPYQLTSEAAQSTQLAQNEQIISNQATQIVMAQSPTPTMPPATRTPDPRAALPLCGDWLDVGDTCNLEPVQQTPTPRLTPTPLIPCSDVAPKVFAMTVCVWDGSPTAKESNGQGGE